MNLTSSEGENYETKCSDLFALTNYNDAGIRKSWGEDQEILRIKLRIRLILMSNKIG